MDCDRVVARLLFQAAFEPLPAGAQIAFHAATAKGALGEQLGLHDVPNLEGGRVCRVSYPLRLAEGATHVGVFIQAPDPARGAERIRTAWKLHDTVEIPKLSEMEPVTVQSGGFNLGASLVGTALMGGSGAFISFGRTTTIPAKTKTKVHKARELPPGLMQEISSAVTAPLTEPVVETVWSSGQPLPAPPPIVYAPRPLANPSAVRRCRACFFEGPAAEYERARSCPNCDEPWD